jgi:hypothetical protein
MYKDRLSVGCEGKLGNFSFLLIVIELNHALYVGQRLLKSFAPALLKTRIGQAQTGVQFPRLKKTATVTSITLDVSWRQLVSEYLTANDVTAAEPGKAWQVTSAIRVGPRRYRTAKGDAKHGRSAMSVCRFREGYICKIEVFLAIPTAVGGPLHLAVIRVFDIREIDGVPYVNPDAGSCHKICDVEELGTLVDWGTLKAEGWNL